MNEAEMCEQQMKLIIIGLKTNMINWSSLEFSLSGACVALGSRQRTPGVGKFKSLWLIPYIVSKVLKKGEYELTNFDGNKFPDPRNGIYLKNTSTK